MTKSQATRFRITPHERAVLEQAAQHRGGTISDALRLAIRAVYMVDPPDPPPTRKETKEAPKFAQTGGASFSQNALPNP